ncbi:uncharacterized protein LOC116340616 [Contarinia nasturtii]|uniref:uncharacterized protein LOC116340616 n=1 Tax=Contarinia nasturtii TaxID=265458 RepID=UPI0012D47196|nr:uncharacterized protein LOC116340616 [Contarinia nasturtii]
MMTFTSLNYTINMKIPIEELYPRKLNTFNKCPIYVAPAITDPFINRCNTFGKNTFYQGIDIEIITQISKKLNFAIEYKQDSTNHGRILSNGTVTGTMNSVYSGQTNITIGGYASTVERSLFFSTSNPYLQASIGFCYKETMGYLPLTAPLKIRLWIVVCVILFIAIVLIMLTKKLNQKWRHFIIGGKLNRTPILNMWAAMLGMCICNPYILRGGKKFGALYTSLRTHRLTSAYDTVEKIQQSNCKVTTSPSGYSIIKNVFRHDRIQISNQTELTVNLRALSNGDIVGVVLATDLAQKRFNLKNYPSRRLAFTKDRLYMYSPVFLFRKKSALRKVFNKQLLALREAGLIEFWTKHFIDHRKLKDKRKPPSKLRIENLYSVFHICGIIYAISVMVFILEIFSAKYQHIKRILDYLTY